jgi:hypothetical protein
MGSEIEEARAADIECYEFFVKYTYSSECALLAFNFHRLSAEFSGIAAGMRCANDRRLISVTLMFVFFKYRLHHCDMALDLALTLAYLEDIEVEKLGELRTYDIFDVVCTLAYLAHVWNADRTIRLRDWYTEVAWRSFPNVAALNAFVMLLLKDVRSYRLKVSDSRVKRSVQRLCAMPANIPHPDPTESQSGHRRGSSNQLAVPSASKANQ